MNLKVVKSMVFLLGNYHIHNDIQCVIREKYLKKNLRAEGLSFVHAIHITKQKQLRSIFLFPALKVQN